MPDGHTIRLGVFKLERTEVPVAGEYGSCVAICATERGARELANQEAGDEGYVWTDGSKVTATRIGDASDATDSASVILWSRGRPRGRRYAVNGAASLGIFKLERQDTPMAGEYTACITVCPSERGARELANREASADGFVWTDGHLVAATRLGDATVDTASVVLWTKE
jgi:hypothetical protein